MNLILRLFFVLLLAAPTAPFMLDRSAGACTGGIFQFKDMFERADVVLRANVTKIENAIAVSSATPRFFAGEKMAALEISEVWKGSVSGVGYLHYTEQNTACGVELKEGETITLFATQGPDEHLYAGWPEISEHSTFNLNESFLVAYRRETEALRAAAKSGDPDEGFAFARHLTRWNDSFGAKVAYQELVDKFDRDTEAYLGLAIAQHGSGEYDQAAKSLQSAIIADASLQQIEPNPETARWASPRDVRIARARFLLTGIFDKYSRDWSDLVANDRCDGIGVSLGDAIFDRSDLTKCSFERARFAETSFMSANLMNVPFERADLQTANFSSANLNGAKFSGARMVNIVWDGADLRGADFSETHKAGPFTNVDISGAKFDGSTYPGPFLAREKNAPMSLDGVSFRDAELSVYAFLTEDGYWPTSELQADISRADFTGAKIDCGDRDELHLKQSPDAMPDFFLPRFLNEQRVATFIRNNWPDVTLTDRCERFVGRKFQ